MTTFIKFIVVFWNVVNPCMKLTNVDAGFSTKLGVFSSTFQRTDTEGYQKLSFNTPNGTTGDVELAGTKGTLVSKNGRQVELVNGAVKGLEGGLWRLEK